MAASPPPGMIWIGDTPAGPGIASRLGIRPGTYRKWRMRGIGPRTFQMGRRVVARIQTVEEWIAQQERAG